MPVDAARNAPTITTETARPPGSGPKTRAMVVRRSSAMRERSSVMPMRTNMRTASSVSMDWPARTRSLMRLTTKETLRSTASSHPPGKTGSEIRGRSGKRNLVMSRAPYPSPSRGPIFGGGGVHRLVDQQPRPVQRGDDAEGDDPRPTDREGHGKPRQDRSEQAEERDDEADLDPVQTQHGPSRPLRGRPGHPRPRATGQAAASPSAPWRREPHRCPFHGRGRVPRRQARCAAVSTSASRSFTRSRSRWSPSASSPSRHSR